MQREHGREPLQYYSQRAPAKLPPRLEFARPAQHGVLLESHFGCRLRFKAGRNALIFGISDLVEPFVTQNEEPLQPLTPHRGRKPALWDHSIHASV